VIKEYAVPEGVAVRNVYIGTPYVNHVLLPWDTDQILGILQDLGIPNVGNGNGNGNGHSNSGVSLSSSFSVMIAVGVWTAVMMMAN